MTLNHLLIVDYIYFNFKYKYFSNFFHTLSNLEIEFRMKIYINCWFKNRYLFIHIFSIFLFKKTNKCKCFLGFLVILNY